MWTKRQLIKQAFVKSGLGSRIASLNAEHYQQALADMDAMMASWNSFGIRIGYAIGSTPVSSDPDQPSGIPDEANAAVYNNLAIVIAPNFGKSVQPEVIAVAGRQYKVLLSKAQSQEVGQRSVINTMPTGSGNRRRRNFFPTPAPTVDAGADGQIDFD